MFKQCEMVGIKFHRATITGGQFEECDLTNAQFDNANLSGAVFKECNLTNIVLNKANIENVSFVNCTQNGKPIMLEWLKSTGALNIDTATITPIKFKIYNPKTLKELTADYLFVNKVHFFKKLSALPSDCIEQFPGLDINCQTIFIRKSKAILNNLQFNPKGEEKTYLQQLDNALNEKNPYNSIHKVIQEIDSKIKINFLSQFKTHMQPIRNELVKLMKEYLLNKKEYELQMKI